MDSAEYESCSKPNVYKKIFFATAFFNALILERRKFGAVGWNIPYDWMNSDLKVPLAPYDIHTHTHAAQYLMTHTMRLTYRLLLLIYIT